MKQREQKAPVRKKRETDLNRNGSSPHERNAASHTDTLTSRDNKWIKLFRSALQGIGPGKDEPIGVESPKLIVEALRFGLEAEALIVSQSGECELFRILQAASESDAGISQSRILRTTDKLFESISGTESPQGVAGLFQQPQWGLEDVLRGSGASHRNEPFVVVLASVQDPGNVGTILRSAEAFGATGAVAVPGTADPWSPKAIRASAGSALRLPILRGMAIPVLLAQLKMNQVKILAASSQRDGETHSNYEWQKDLRGAVALCIGNEGGGLPLEVERAADARISIPMSQTVESLNAGVAASLMLYEAARQRKSET